MARPPYAERLQQMTDDELHAINPRLLNEHKQHELQVEKDRRARLEGVRQRRESQVDRKVSRKYAKIGIGLSILGIVVAIVVAVTL